MVVDNADYRRRYFAILSILDEQRTEADRRRRLHRIPETLADAVEWEREFGLTWCAQTLTEPGKKRAKVERLKSIARDFRVPYATVKQMVG